MGRGTLYFQERAAAARQQPGWVGVQLSVPPENPFKCIVIGTWESYDDWQSWHAIEAFKRTPERMVGSEVASRERWWHQVALEDHR